MKNNILLLFILFLVQFNLSAQKIDNRRVLIKIHKCIQKDNLECFTAAVADVISGTNADNINDRLVLFDSIINISEGGFTDYCDTIIDVLRRNYLVQLLKYLPKRKESAFETAYISFMIAKIKYSIQQKVAISNFEANINKALPSLTQKEKDYALAVKSQILSKVY